MPSPISSSHATPRVAEPIIVVSGLPRSGTSMAMQMLEAAGIPPVTDALREANEDNPRGYYEDERVKKLHKTQDTSWLQEASGKSIKVVSFFLKNLPDTHKYKVIFMERDLDEVLASQQKMLARSGNKDNTSDTQLYEIYKQHLIETKHYLQNQPHFDTLYVSYSEVARNPLSQAIRICEFIARPLKADDMAQAVDNKLYRNRR